MTKPERARVTVVTSGHLSTCPRMLKAADALAADGFDVRVVATRHEPWATDADRDVASRRSWKAAVIDYRRDGGSAVYWRSGVRYRAARAAAQLIGPARVPMAVVAGALAAIAEAGRRSGTRYAVDLEDFHSGETAGADAPLVDALAARVEHTVMKDAAFVTTSSAAIAAAYQTRDGVRPSVIDNTFPLPLRAPDVSRVDAARLRVYWFSQTIGPGRGLEDAVLALGRAGMGAHLALRGRAQTGYFEALSSLAAVHAPRLELVHLPPAPPDAMVDCARGYDVGLALEQMTPRNRQLCLPNKPFTYILAGMAVAMSDTPGQRALGADLGRGAAVVPPGDVDALAAAFVRWAGDPAELDCAKRTAWNAATRRWHWEQDLERGRLLALVHEAIA